MSDPQENAATAALTGKSCLNCSHLIVCGPRRSLAETMDKHRGIFKSTAEETNFYGRFYNIIAKHCVYFSAAIPAKK